MYKNWLSTVVSRGYRDSLGSSWLFKDTPVVVLAEASNTIRSFMVVDDSLNTLCIGR